MAEDRKAPEKSGAQPGSGEGLVLVVVIVGSQQALDDVVTGLLDLGMGGTLLESKGLAALLREEMPIFSGLAAMLPESSRTRTIISVTTREKATQLLTMLEKTVKSTQRAVAFTVPVDAAIGPRL